MRIALVTAEDAQDPIVWSGELAKLQHVEAASRELERLIQKAKDGLPRTKRLVGFTGQPPKTERGKCDSD